MTKTLLCFGDSNTHGTVALQKLGEFKRLGRQDRWPGRLANTLGTDWHVIEEGHPGRTTVHDDPIEGPHRNGLTILPSLLETHRPIDLLILMLGTNDLKPRFSVTPTDIALSVERLITVIKSSGCGPDGHEPAIILAAPVPITETGVLGEVFKGGAAKSQELSLLYQLCAERTGCTFFDAGTVAKTDPTDGVHLNKDAHTAIADALTSLIKKDFT